jgi:hypothetical protein
MDHQGSLWDLGSPDMPARQPPAQQHSATSVAAAEAIKPVLNQLEKKVLDWIAEQGDYGATRQEVEFGTWLPGDTVRPRVVDLLKYGLIEETTETRPTTSGRLAFVLKVKNGNSNGK